MSDFRQFLLNPNVQLWTALALGIASFIPVLAPISAVLQTVGLTLTGTGALIPEKTK